MAEKSDGRKLAEIGAWIFTRGAVVAVAYTLLKAGQFVVLRFI